MVKGPVCNYRGVIMIYRDRYIDKTIIYRTTSNVGKKINVENFTKSDTNFL